MDRSSGQFPRIATYPLFVGLTLMGLTMPLSGCQNSEGPDASQNSDDEAETDDTESNASPGSTEQDSSAPKPEDEKSKKNNKDQDPNEDDKDPGEDEEPGDPGENPKFDLSFPDVEEDNSDKDKPGDDCEEVEHHPCDQNSKDPLHAIGINCPGEQPQINATFRGDPRSRAVRTSLGKTNAFAPREGARYLVLGSGIAAEMDKPTPMGDKDVYPTHCNDILGAKWSVGDKLPAPIKTNRVGAQDCKENPALVGTGDCSNTIQDQWEAAGGNGKKGRANDYAELRLKVKVPAWANSLSYQFSFLTTEYPVYFGQVFNDFFIAWLESEKWTGNISFDEKGKPISLNAGFLDYRDAVDGTHRDPDCKNGCEAPELHGTCLQRHAGTKWLTTKVGVTPGEEIELVFAIMDLSDSGLDSFVLIDDFRWSCDEQEKPETEDPPG